MSIPEQVRDFPQRSCGYTCAVGRTWSAVSVEPKIVLHKDGLEKLGLPLGKNEVGPGVRRRC